MTFIEWLDNVNNANLFNSFPKLKQFLTQKYKSYELKYSDQSTNRQVDSLLIEYYPTLISIEKAFLLRENTDLTLDNLGDKQIIKGTDKTIIEGTDSKNYVGYEVLGEFEKQLENRSDNKSTDQTITSYNFLNVLNSLENQGHKVAWNSFEQKFIKLFILIFTIDI